jgi:hypothetical protein
MARTLLEMEARRQVPACLPQIDGANCERTRCSCMPESIVPSSAWHLPKFLSAALALGMLVVACGTSSQKPRDDDGSAGAGNAIDPPTCEEGKVCDGVCVDLLTSGRNCGACGVACGETFRCIGGKCACAENNAACETGCVPIKTDPNNCGSCGNKCKEGRSCEDGKCVCPEGSTVCSGTCVDLQKSQEHCGECGLRCGPLDVCQNGICRHTPGPSNDGCGGSARNVSLRQITWNQGVEVPVYSDDEEPEENAPLLSGRPLLVRAFVDVEPAFTKRTLAARLFLSSDNEPSVYYDKREISFDSRPYDLDTTFQFLVPAAALMDSAELAIEVVECDLSVSGPVLSPRAPKEGELSLELQESPEISVAIVPIEHDGRLPDTSEEHLAPYARTLEAMFPLAQAKLAVLPPMTSGQEGTLDFDALLTRLQERRATDQPAPDIYYFGFVRPKATLKEHCSSSDCTYGIGYQTRSSAFRVALGIEYGDRASEDTFVHELGHNMGLGHAPCGTDGDPKYPYPDAALGSLGFDFRSQEALDPTETKDVMSYCEPTWVSDYTYRTVFSALNRAQRALRAKAEGAPSVTTSTFLSIRTRDGVARVGAAPYRLEIPEEAPLPGLVLGAEGTELLEIQVYRITTGDSPLVTWLIPEPEQDWYTVRLPDGTEVPLSRP